jgi:ribosomal protein S28E/S33
LASAAGSQQSFGIVFKVRAVGIGDRPLEDLRQQRIASRIARGIGTQFTLGRAPRLGCVLVDGPQRHARIICRCMKPPMRINDALLVEEGAGGVSILRDLVRHVLGP